MTVRIRSGLSDAITAYNQMRTANASAYRHGALAARLIRTNWKIWDATRPDDANREKLKDVRPVRT